MRRIILSGGEGELAKKIFFFNKKYKIYALNKKTLDITNYKNVIKVIKKFKPNYFIHTAALSSPMTQHEKDPIESINVNIIGTSNVVKACYLSKTKLIYISTNFVYPGKKGNYKEAESLNPINLYGWSKLGGECAVKFLKDSLIIRACITKKPFPHKYAFTNYVTSFLSNDDAAKIILKLVNKKGIINMGGKIQTPYEYAIKENKNILRKKISLKQKKKMGYDTSLDSSNLKNILKNF